MVANLVGKIAGDKMKEKYIAALLGLAVGDALGFPFEGARREEFTKVNLCYFERSDFPPGTWSDDTSLTFLTAESLLARRGLDLEDLAARFWRWLAEGYFTPFGKALGLGRATREALFRYARGISPEKAGGAGERDCGNGSLMRILPVVLWYARSSEERLLAEVYRASSLTHAHPRVLLACGLYALLLRAFIFGKSLSEAFLNVRERATVHYLEDPFFAGEVSHFTPLFNGTLFFLPREEISTSGYVVHTLLATFWILFRTTNFPQAVKLAVRFGGDTDTTAAVVGAAAGLYYGLSEIPALWLRELIQKEKLFDLAKTFGDAVCQDEA